MRHPAIVLFLTAILLPSFAAANTIINYTVTSLGGNSFRYNYQLSGVVLHANQELDIEFDPTTVTSVSNGVAPAPFDLELFQPNHPATGALGVYSLFTVVNNPSTAGTFSVDLISSLGGQPDNQQFFIYDDNFAPLLLVDQGTTSPVGGAVAPEPCSLWLVFSVFFAGSAGFAVRRVTFSRLRWFHPVFGMWG